MKEWDNEEKVKTMRLLAEGCLEKDIAKEIGRTYFAVRHMLQKIRFEYDATTNVQLIAMAVKDGII